MQGIALKINQTTLVTIYSKELDYTIILRDNSSKEFRFDRLLHALIRTEIFVFDSRRSLCQSWDLGEDTRVHPNDTLHDIAQAIVRGEMDAQFYFRKWHSFMVVYVQSSYR
jgi:hypothetical protein